MSNNEKLQTALEDANEKLSVIRAAREDRAARLGLTVSDNKVTLAAKERCAAHSLQEQLQAMRAVELALLEKRAKILRMEIAADQSDIETAFQCDRVMPVQSAADEAQRIDRFIKNCTL